MSQLSAFLIKNFNDDKRPTTDYALRVEHLEDGTVKFYIHPQGDQAKTLYLELSPEGIVSPWIRSKMVG